MFTLSNSPQPVALLGGTFDPIHLGHTQPALQLADTFGWAKIHLQPCFAPPHRPAPAVSDQHRFNMVKLACEDDARLVADDFELRQQRPTRTVHTLAHLQQLHPGASLCFIMGMDSLINFTSWLNWSEILQLAHLFVLPRPGYHTSQIPAPLLPYVVAATDATPTRFATGTGRIYLADTQPLDISATQLRTQLARSHSMPNRPCPAFIAPQVYAYIQAHNLYQ